MIRNLVIDVFLQGEWWYRKDDPAAVQERGFTQFRKASSNVGRVLIFGQEEVFHGLESTVILLQIFM